MSTSQPAPREASAEARMEAPGAVRTLPRITAVFWVLTMLTAAWVRRPLAG